MTCKPLLRPLCSFLLLLFPFGLASLADDLTSVAEKLAAQLEKAHNKNLFPRVVVSSFFTSNGHVSQLTENLSSEFSDEIAARLDRDRVVNHSLFVERLKLDLLTPLDLRDPAIATWLAERVGANTVVFGTLTLDGPAAELRVSAIFLADHKLIAESQGTLTLTPEMQALSEKPLLGTNQPRLQVGCDQAGGKRSKEIFRKAGVEMPKCIRCPDPPYSEEARRKKYQGTIALNVIVDEKGSTVPLSPITISSPQLAGLDIVDGALSVIRTWKFHPAMRSGEPVAVCAPIEISFRLF